VRAVILNGAFAGDETIAIVEADLASALAGRGWEVERLHLRDLTIAYCKGCFGCWVKTPGVCPTRDDAGAVTRSFVRSDLAVLVTPVVFGGCSSELKKALDRSAGIVLPFFTRIHGEVHHQARYQHREPGLAVAGNASRRSPACDRKTFRSVVHRAARPFTTCANCGPRSARHRAGVAHARAHAAARRRELVSSRPADTSPPFHAVPQSPPRSRRNHGSASQSIRKQPSRDRRPGTPIPMPVPDGTQHSVRASCALHVPAQHQARSMQAGLHIRFGVARD
jgi:multimeric flavodoxin WrbA